MQIYYYISITQIIYIVIEYFSNMTGCTAPGCTNSDQKGYVMKIFPRDPIRRAQWTTNVNRKRWTPTEIFM